MFLIRRFFSNALAIDLGSANTRIYKLGEGIVLNEPSIVATYHQYDSSKQTVLATGSQAKLMIGKTPDTLRAINPIQNGVIADSLGSEQLIKHFIKPKFLSRLFRARPRVLACIPSRATQVEQSSLREVMFNAGARTVELIEKPIAAAIGAGLPISDPEGSMIVDIGAGTTEIAILSMGGTLHKSSLRIGCNEMDNAIISYLRRNYRVLIGTATAELIRERIGSAFPTGEIHSVEITGHSLSGGGPKTFIVNSNEILEALSGPLEAILSATKIALEHTPPELTSDLKIRGITLSGGGSLLNNLPRLFLEGTGMPISVSNDPLLCAVKGCGALLTKSRINPASLPGLRL